MTRICSRCEFENQDDYDYCAKCGTPLVEGLKPNNVIVVKAEPRLNKKIMILSYLITIFLSWSGFVVTVLTKHSSMGIFTFFGFFIPFYLIQAPIRELRRHGIIQLLIATVGVTLSLYVMLN